MARVLYAGPALSGRETSLAVIARASYPLSGASWSRLARGIDVALPSGPCRVEIGCLHLGVTWYPSIAAAAASRDPRAAENARRALDWAGTLAGIVFVVDSQRARIHASLELLELLADAGLGPDRERYVLQLNKRDLPTAVAVDEIRAATGLRDAPVVETNATRDPRGVRDALDAVFSRDRVRPRSPP